MKIKRTKKIIKSILPVGLMAGGSISPIVMTSCEDEGKKSLSGYTLSYKNIESIRTFFIKSYTEKLTKAGVLTNDIVRSVQKATSDIDSIIGQGKTGGFSPEQIYATVWNYAKTLTVEVFDWEMFDHVVQKQIESLKQKIYSSALPTNQKQLLFDKYNNLLKVQIQSTKAHTTSPDKAMNDFKTFSHNVATQELDEQTNELAQYYLENFRNSSAFGPTANLYWDQINFDYFHKGSTLPIFWFTFRDVQSLNNNNLPNVLNENSINAYYNLSKSATNYKLSITFDKWNNDTKELSAFLHMKSEDGGISLVASEQIIIKIPESLEHKKTRVLNELNQHIITTDITMLSWETAIEKIKELGNTEISRRITNGLPLYTDENLSNFGPLIYVDGTPYTQKNNFFNSEDFDVDLNIYNYNEQMNSVNCSLAFYIKDRDDLEKFPHIEEEITPTTFLIKTLSLPPNYPVADQETINQLKNTVKQLTETYNSYSDETEARINNLRILNITMAVEQGVVSLACAVMAGIYFAAAPLTFGATTLNGILATIGSVAAAAGAAMSTIAALEYEARLTEIREAKKTTYFADFMLLQHDFIMGSDYGMLMAATYGSRVSIDFFLQLLKEVIPIVQAINQCRDVVWLSEPVKQAAATFMATIDTPIILTEENNYVNMLYKILHSEADKSLLSLALVSSITTKRHVPSSMSTWIFANTLPNMLADTLKNPEATSFSHQQRADLKFHFTIDADLGQNVNFYQNNNWLVDGGEFDKAMQQVLDNFRRSPYAYSSEDNVLLQTLNDFFHSPESFDMLFRSVARNEYDTLLGPLFKAMLNNITEIGRSYLQHICSVNLNDGQLSVMDRFLELLDRNAVLFNSPNGVKPSLTRTQLIPRRTDGSAIDIGDQHTWLYSLTFSDDGDVESNSAQNFVRGLLLQELRDKQSIGLGSVAHHENLDDFFGMFGFSQPNGGDFEKIFGRDFVINILGSRVTQRLRHLPELTAVNYDQFIQDHIDPIVRDVLFDHTHIGGDGTNIIEFFSVNSKASRILALRDGLDHFTALNGARIEKSAFYVKDSSRTIEGSLELFRSFQNTDRIAAASRTLGARGASLTVKQALTLRGVSRIRSIEAFITYLKEYRLSMNILSGWERGAIVICPIAEVVVSMADIAVNIIGTILQSCYNE